MTVLRSYIGDEWVTPDDEGTPVHDAVTGDDGDNHPQPPLSEPIGTSEAKATQPSA